MPAVTPLMVDSKADPMEQTKGPASPSSQLAQAEKTARFATPDRDIAPELPQAPTSRVEVGGSDQGSMPLSASAAKPNTVTPLESGSREDSKKSEAEQHLPGDDLAIPGQSNKQVRFDGDSEVGTDANKESSMEGDATKGLSPPVGAPADSPASSTGSSGSKRGLVSRRGGRYGSPTRLQPASSSSPSASAAPVLEYKAFRSPARKTKTEGGNMDNDTIPSLTSSHSGGLQSTSSSSGEPKRPLDMSEGNRGDASTAADGPGPDQDAAVKEEPTGTGEAQTVSDSSRQTVPQSGGSSSAAVGVDKKGKPTSITCDSSMIESTSPLASHDVDGSPSAAAARKPADAQPDPSSTSEPAKAASRLKTEGDQGVENENFGGRRNVTFSPPQAPRDSVFDRPRKTPTKSPVGQFQSLPSLHDAKLQSPCGIFLSPYSPSPSAYQTITEVPSFDRPLAPGNKQTDDAADGSGTKSFPDEKSSKARDQERERAVSTPTDFAFDFGKGHDFSASFDASNVLAWLQSPTAHGLFSPGGGFGSSTNTPRGRFAGPRTPRTPTVGTSFFFSDVASFPRNGEFTSPKPQGASEGGPKRGGTGGQQGPMSSMICISPLASSRRGGQGASSQPQAGGQSDTPSRFKDVFASPRLPMPRGNEGPSGKPRSMPMLGESPAKGSKNRGRSNLDAVHMAERDLMEDEDLSVLLQLASHSNTSGHGPGGSGPHVFRSPRSRTKGQHEQRGGGYGNPGAASGGALPGLQLPIIGGHGGEGTKAKLTRKTAFREPADANDFTPPPLSIRSSSSGGSKEIYLGGTEAGKDRASGSKSDGTGSSSTSAKAGFKNGSTETSKRSKSSSGASKSSISKKAAKKGVATGNAASAYVMPGSMPYPPHPGADPNVQYYPMHGTMPLPPGGNMRVVVGGPPPGGRSGGANASPRSDKYSSSPHRPPPYVIQPAHGKENAYGAPVPPPPPGAYPRQPYGHPPPPHMGGMPMPPPYHYPPHPHHMPMYATQHPPGAAKSAPKKSKPKAPKSAKRAADGKATTPTGKKQKKSPSKSSKKRKPQSATTMSEPVDRQKAAAAIAAVNQASGGKNDRAAALAAAILRGVTMRPSGKWQAQLYYAGKSRYIGVFDTREKAALAYEIAREKLKADNKTPADQSAQSLKATEAAVNAARKAAFEGVNEKDPRLSSK